MPIGKISWKVKTINTDDLMLVKQGLAHLIALQYSTNHATRPHHLDCLRLGKGVRATPWCAKKGIPADATAFRTNRVQFAMHQLRSCTIIVQRTATI